MVVTVRRVRHASLKSQHLHQHEHQHHSGPAPPAGRWPAYAGMGAGNQQQTHTQAQPPPPTKTTNDQQALGAALSSAHAACATHARTHTQLRHCAVARCISFFGVNSFPFKAYFFQFTRRGTSVHVSVCTDVHAEQHHQQHTQILAAHVLSSSCRHSCSHCRSIGAMADGQYVQLPRLRLGVVRHVSSSVALGRCSLVRTCSAMSNARPRPIKTTTNSRQCPSPQTRATAWTSAVGRG